MAAKTRALQVQSNATAQAALYRAKIFHQAKTAANLAKSKFDAAWAALLAETKASYVASVKARSVLFGQWQEAETRMKLAITQVANVQTDIISQATVVVENARKQAYILLKAREENEKAVKAAMAATMKAREALLAIESKGANSK